MPALVQTKYEDEFAQIHAFKLTATYAAVAGTPPTGAVNNSILPKISKSNREYGLRPRGVRLSRTVGTAPNTFKKYTFLPILTVAGSVEAGFAIGAEITIDGVAWTVTGKVPEDY